MNTLNLNTTVLIVSFAVLVVTMVVAAVLLWQSNQRGGKLIGVLMIAACLLLIVGAVSSFPTLLTNAGAQVQVAAAAQGGAATTVVPPSPTQIPATATATTMPSPTITPTGLPTLTPAPSATDIVLVTPLTYAHADSAATINCSVTANTMLNLRGDPSAKQRAIGRVFAGSLLPVTGQSADKQWVRVNSTSGDMTVEGWVSLQYVTVDKVCDMTTIPVLDAK